MSFEDNESDGSPSGSVFLSLVVAVLCLCVLIIPILMGKADLKGDEKQFVQKQMQQIVDHHFAEAVPIALKKNVMANGGYASPALNSSTPAAPDQVFESAYKENKELSQARELRFHGKTDEAIRVMESYVLQHPKAVVARIELANCYLKSKQLRKARLACIAGLMSRPSGEEKKTLWQMIERCPKG